MLRLENISKNFGGFSISNINLEVAKGEYFVLLGASGAGKSVVLEVIAGLMKANSGKVFLNEKDITHESIQSRKVGLVFQDYAVFPHLTVFQNIAYSFSQKRKNRTQITETVEKLADEMSIKHLLSRKAETLSGGEKQRVAIARTLARKPDILLLDEPLSALDAQLKAELRKLLRKINKQGQTILHVTHDYDEAIALADKIAIVQNGTIVQDGDIREVFQNPRTHFVANFIGIKNYYNAEIFKIKRRGIKIAKITEEVSFRLETTAREGTQGKVYIETESVIVFKEKTESSARNNFKGRICDIIRVKQGIELVADIGIKISALITQEALEKFDFKEDTEVWLSFKATSVQFVEDADAE